MVVTLPMIMWLMDLTLFKALAIDLSFSLFVPIYALVYNCVYDLAFPVPQYGLSYSVNRKFS